MMGRPKKPDSERKGNVLRIRLTEEEREALDEASKMTNQETSTWARKELLALAGRIANRKRTKQ